MGQRVTNMRKITTAFCLVVFTSLVILFAQGAGTGTPKTLRVLTDANNYLMVSSAAQTLPLSQPTQFSNTRLVTDASGYLLVALAGGTYNGPLTITAGTATTAISPLSITQTVNNASTVFPGIKFVMTEGASGTASGTNLFDLWYGTSGNEASKFSVSKTGVVSALTFSATSLSNSLLLGNGRVKLNGTDFGVAAFTNDTATGFTTLNLGPTTGNTASGTLSLSKNTSSCVVATSTCTGGTATIAGVGTGTITISNAIPTGAIVKYVTLRWTVALTGASLTTVKVGDGTITNAWGNTLAIDLNTVSDSTTATYLSTWAPKFYVSGGNIVITANAGVISTGTIAFTVMYDTSIARSAV